MDPAGKARPERNNTYSGNHSLESRPHSTSSSIKDEVTQPHEMDLEKAASLDENREKSIHDVVPAGPDPSAFPDGGYDAWLAVAGGFCTIFSSFGWINCTFPSVLNATSKPLGKAEQII
jgi:hypothetical protein